MAMETYSYGLRDLKIATWTAANSYGTAVDIDAAHDFTVTFNAQTAQLEGDDVIKDRFSKIISASATLTYGSVNQQVLAILSGGTLVSNAQYEDVLMSQDDNPAYFCIAGRVVGTGGGVGDTHIFLPKCKVNGSISYKAAYGSYLMPSLDIEGVHEGSVNGIARIRKFTATTTLEIPLKTTTG